MPVIEHSSRRFFLGLCVSLTLRADEGLSTLKLVTNLAAKLSDGNLPGVLEAFAKTMNGYQNLVADLGALTNQYDVICVIEIRQESGDEAQRNADTEWFVQLKSKQDEGPTERRTVPVRISTARLKGKWRIMAIEPQSVLAPPQVR